MRRSSPALVAAAVGMSGVGHAGSPVAAARPAEQPEARGASTSASEPSRVILHGSRDGGEAIGVSSAGVAVRGAGGESIIGWDRVWKVEGPLAAEARAFEGVASLAWRARARLERGDAVAAEPLYEELFDHLDQVSGPTALSICEGLLRCRLWRGAHARAMEAWLRWVRVAGEEGAAGMPEGVAGERRRIWAMALLPVIDEATGLVTSLPPVWVPGPSVRALVAGPSPVPGPEDEGPGVERARALGALYLHAARAVGGDPRPAPEIAPALLTDPGVSLVHDLVLAQAGAPAQRASAREALRARLAAEEIDSWQEAWCRVGLGRSLLAEGDDDSVMAGVVQLMHLPARFGDEQPYLTGVALADAADALTRLGDLSGAATLDTLLVQQFGDHPALEWAELRRVSGGTTSNPANSPARGSSGGSGEGSAPSVAPGGGPVGEPGQDASPRSGGPPP